LVHGYTNVDPAVVEGVLTEHLGDLEQFVAEIRAALAKRHADDPTS
jgi:uncharacterized protein YutE (UPF0331/DUF86 family)